jgi:cell division protein FtsN
VTPETVKSKHPHRAVKSAPPRRSAGGLILGMFIGLIVGLAIALGVAFYLNKTPIPFLGKSKPPASKDAAPETPRAVAGMPQGGAAAPKGEKPKFDFYKILPGGEEAVSEKELKDAAKAEAGKAGKPPADAARNVYFIQAGSFQNPADADNQKAKIALLGFESAVEPTALPDKGTWYRVRLGPYTSLEDLNRVRRVLSQNGIDANLVKMKDLAAAKDN